jgi:hypothetical protein
VSVLKNVKQMYKNFVAPCSHSYCVDQKLNKLFSRVVRPDTLCDKESYSHLKYERVACVTCKESIFHTVLFNVISLPVSILHNDKTNSYFINFLHCSTNFSLIIQPVNQISFISHNTGWSRILKS